MLLDLFVRVGNRLPGVENPDPQHRVRVQMRNDQAVQKQKTLRENHTLDATTMKLTRLVRLLAQQEALDFAARTATIAVEVQP